MSANSAKRLTRQKRPSEAVLNRRLIWKAGNFGVLTEIALLSGKSNTFVGQILRGERTNATVEQLLAERGAPGFSIQAEHLEGEALNA